MTSKTLLISEFSRNPTGRTDGEAFRVNHLVPALTQFDHVIVDLSGTLGLGCSFLDGAFGGLETFTVPELKQRLTIRGGVPSDITLSWKRIEDGP